MRHKSNQGCPVKGVTCHSCGGRNHRAKACACPKKGQHSSREGSCERIRGHGHRHGWGRRRGCGSSSNRNAIHYVDQEEASDGDKEEYENVKYYAINIAIDAVSTKESAFATPDLCLPGRTTHDILKLKVHTGTEGNILPLCIYRCTFPWNLEADGFPRADRMSKWPGVKLSAYNGGEIKNTEQ